MEFSFWELTSFILFIINLGCYARVSFELAFNIDSHRVQCLLHLPLVISTAIFTFGFGIQNILVWLVGLSGSSNSVVIMTHIGILGLFAWLPTIVVALFIPFKALRGTIRDDFDYNVGPKDIFYPSFFAVFVAIIFWIISIFLTPSEGFTEYTFYYSLDNWVLCILIGIQFIVFTLCTFCFWFWGLQAYLLSVFNKMDSMTPTQVFTGHSHLQAQNYPQLVDLFTDSVTVSPEEYKRNHGLSDLNLQKCGASAGVVMSYDSHFRYKWFYILTVILALVLSSSIRNFTICNVSFIICQTCGIQACALFFNSKVLFETRRHLFPCLFCFHKSSEKVEEVMQKRMAQVQERIEMSITSSHNRQQLFTEEGMEGHMTALEWNKSLSRDTPMQWNHTLSRDTKFTEEIISLPQMPPLSPSQSTMEWKISTTAPPYSMREQYTMPMYSANDTNRTEEIVRTIQNHFNYVSSTAHESEFEETEDQTLCFSSGGVLLTSDGIIPDGMLPDIEDSFIEKYPQPLAGEESIME